MKVLLNRDYVLMLSCSLLLTLVAVSMGPLSRSIKGGVLFEGLVLVLWIEREMYGRYQVTCVECMVFSSFIKNLRCESMMNVPQLADTFSLLPSNLEGQGVV